MPTNILHGPLGKKSPHTSSPIKDVKELGSDQPVQWQQFGGGLVLELPDSPTDLQGYSIKAVF